MRNNRNFNTLFNKMFLVMSLSMLIPIAILGILSFERSRQQIESVTSQFLQDNLGLNSKQIKKILSNVEEESQRIASSGKLQEILVAFSPADNQNEAQLPAGMKEIPPDLKSYYQMAVLPKDSEAYLQYFERIQKSGKEGIWAHEWDRETARPLFIYARLIRSTVNSEILGILALHVPEYMVREELASPSSFHNYTLLLADNENYIISHPNAELYSKKYYYEEYFPTDKWKKGEILLNSDGWKLIAAVPRAELTGSIYQIKDFTIWIVLISMAVVTLLLFILVRTFTIPVKKLVIHMNEVKRGLLNPFSHYLHRKDEIGQLVSGYNQMVVGMLELLKKTKAMESDKRNLELQTLNYQINPHFFYNTLDAIKWRAEYSNESIIAAMVTKLANLLRFSLNNGEEWTTVEREIEHARNYLDIELLRSNRTFQVFIQISPEIRKRKVIKLILQPIMENAVKHGISKLPEGKGKIKLTAKRSEDDDIIFIIEDNGPGLQDERYMNLDQLPEREGSGGIGLVNVHRRLQLHFGSQYGVLVHPNRNAGFRVEVLHPLFEDENGSGSDGSVGM